MEELSLVIQVDPMQLQSSIWEGGRGKFDSSEMWRQKQTLREAAMSQRMSAASKTWKRQGTGFLPEALERISPDNTLISEL